VETEPDGEVENHADYRYGDGGERGGEFFVAAELLDVRSAKEDPKEARNESRNSRISRLKSE
jgi:hypothetical protein